MTSVFTITAGTKFQRATRNSDFQQNPENRHNTTALSSPCWSQAPSGCRDHCRGQHRDGCRRCRRCRRRRRRRCFLIGSTFPNDIPQWLLRPLPVNSTSTSTSTSTSKPILVKSRHSREVMSLHNKSTMANRAGQPFCHHQNICRFM